jgi:hypothetical protein
MVVATAKGRFEIVENRTASGRDCYSVTSPSGNTYQVTFCGSGDGDPDIVRLWECNCPAGQHGKPCKHIAAVIAMVDEDEDIDHYNSRPI